MPNRTHAQQAWNGLHPDQAPRPRRHATKHAALRRAEIAEQQRIDTDLVRLKDEFLKREAARRAAA